ncbi:uncharacterized protein LOC131669756 [Phymastichus coffea]|uniref:uncharacterized protein LOC131669756 n=1 Tax=Phymastichus coffea TaxID=108790 RepID=UPI00273CE1DF|nr:uncharacterized protein LOC131669756 [Phymastichus coffea]
MKSYILKDSIHSQNHAFLVMQIIFKHFNENYEETFIPVENESQISDLTLYSADPCILELNKEPKEFLLVKDCNVFERTDSIVDAVFIMVAACFAFNHLYHD